MTFRQTISHARAARGRWAFVTAALIVAIGQVGRVPIPDVYRQLEELMYANVTMAAIRDAPAADLIIMGDSRILFAVRAEDLAGGLRLPGHGGKPPVVIHLAVSAGDCATCLCFWRRMTRHSQPRATVLVVGVSDTEVMAKAPGRDLASRRR